MWPLSVISDKLSKMIGDRGEGEEGQELAPKALISFTRRSHYVDVPHVRQLFHWDCGLACVLMVLKTLGIDRYDIHDLEKLCHTTSIWTVDLAYLLHNFSVDFSFFTVTVGVNPNYSAENFYREQLQDDIVRVDELFAKALHAGISIQSKSIRAEDIAVLLLSGHCIAVALVDKAKLSHSWMNDIDDTECYSGRSDYMGHYVVICGYDADTGEFEIRDPAISRKHERVSMECLDEARKSFGTDEDILLAFAFSNLSITSVLALYGEEVSLNGKDGHKVSSRLLM